MRIAGEYGRKKLPSILETLHTWMLAQRNLVPEGSAIAKALDYSLKRWAALTRYVDDGAVTIRAFENATVATATRHFWSRHGLSNCPEAEVPNLELFLAAPKSLAGSANTYTEFLEMSF